jgi:hypothetical protein
VFSTKEQRDRFSQVVGRRGADDAPGGVDMMSASPESQTSPNRSGATQPDILAAVRLTVFQDRFARSKTEELIDLAGLCTFVRTTSARAKGKLPLLKLATFGDLRSDKDSLRHNANVLAICGLEADYDGERVSFEDACSILSEARVAALAYTSPSHTEDSPRWRVLCPFSKEYPPDRRDALMGRLSGLFRGIFSVESWTLSQSFYLGSVSNNPSHRAEIITGTPIDLLTRGWLRIRPKITHKLGEARSGHVW